MVKNPLANAGDGFDIWSGMIPHIIRQINLCIKLLKPAYLEPALKH